MKKAVLTVFVVFISLFSVSAYATDNEFMAQVRAGFEMLENGLLREARFRFLRADELSRDNAAVMNNIAVIAEIDGDYEMAYEYYSKAINAAATDPTIAYNANAFRKYCEKMFGSVPGSFEARGVNEKPVGERIIFPAPTKIAIHLGARERIVLDTFEVDIVDSASVANVNKKDVAEKIRRQAAAHLRTKKRTRTAVIGTPAASNNNVPVSAVIEISMYDEAGHRTETYVSPFDGVTYERQILVEVPGAEFDATVTIRGEIERVRGFFPFVEESGKEMVGKIPSDNISVVVEKVGDAIGETIVKSFEPRVEKATRYLLHP